MYHCLFNCMKLIIDLLTFPDYFGILQQFQAFQMSAHRELKKQAK